MKLNLIYYKNLLDGVIEFFVDSYNDCFVRENDRYIFSAGMSKTKLKTILEQYVVDAINQINSEVVNKNDYLIVIGSCYPINHLLLQFKDDEYFPKKLQSILDNKPSLKWILREKNIEIDIDLINEILIDIFNSFFTSQNKCQKTFSANNVMFVQHSHLDCYMMFKVIKWIYGNCNCINIWKDHLANQQMHLVALNDLISKYIQNKNAMNKSKQFKSYAFEVKEYLNNKLQIRM